jgi:hypothetical protein
MLGDKKGGLFIIHTQVPVGMHWEQWNNYCFQVQTSSLFVNVPKERSPAQQDPV